MSLAVKCLTQNTLGVSHLGHMGLGTQLTAGAMLLVTLEQSWLIPSKDLALRIKMLPLHGGKTEEGTGLGPLKMLPLSGTDGNT